MLECSAVQGGIARELATSDRAVSNLVQVHRDDASTDSGDASPAAAPPQPPPDGIFPAAASEEAATGSVEATPVSHYTSRSPDSSTVARRPEDPADTASSSSRPPPRGARQWYCFNPLSARGQRCSWGVTPMACLFGGGFGSEAGSATARRAGNNANGGQEAVPGGGCGPVPGHAWVCAVLPVDSCSDNDSDEEDGANGPTATAAAAGAAAGPEDASVASTCTPPAQTVGTPEAEGNTVSSLSPSDNRSEPSLSLMLRIGPLDQSEGSIFA